LQVIAQDTLSIYFKLGSAKLADTSHFKINKYLNTIDVNTLDSIYFVGVADTIGNSAKNLLLSKKRAKNVSKSFLSNLPESLHYNVLAKGEEINTFINESRRVEIILFFKQIETKKILGCYSVDYELLHRINIKYPKQTKKKKPNSKKRGNIVIRVHKDDIDTSRHYSYAKFNKKGEYQIVPLKWRLKITGVKSFSKARFEAKMPYASFDSTKFFSIDPLPCKLCQDTLSTKIIPLKEVECLQVDRFLMKNIQYKRLLFNPKKIKARVPQDFINYNDIYYYGCSSDILKWKRKSSKYSFTKLPIEDVYVRKVSRIMPCCSLYQEPSGCDVPALILTRIIYPKGNSYLHFQIEEEYNKNFTTSVGLSVTFDSFKFHTLYFMGLNTQKQYSSLLRFQYAFFSFPMGYFLECVSWGSLALPAGTSKFSKFYVGADFHAYLGDVNSNLSQNINLGFAFVNYSDSAIVKRFFVQYEYWSLNNRYANNNGLRIGILTKLHTFKKSNI